MRSGLTVGVPAARGQIRGCGGRGWRSVRWGKLARGRQGRNRFPQEFRTNLAPWGGGKQPPASLPFWAPTGGNAAEVPNPSQQSGVRSPGSRRQSRTEPGRGPGRHEGRLGGDPVGQPGLGTGTGVRGSGRGTEWGCFLLLSQSAPPLNSPCSYVGMGWGVLRDLHPLGGDGLVTPPQFLFCVCSAAPLPPPTPSLGDAWGGVGVSWGAISRRCLPR